MARESKIEVEGKRDLRVMFLETKSEVVGISRSAVGIHGRQAMAPDLDWALMPSRGFP